MILNNSKKQSRLTLDLAEFIGMHIGDGTIYKTSKNSYVWEMRGDIKEKEYYDFYVVPLITKLFKHNFKAKKRSGGKNGCYGIQTTNKDLINTLFSFKIKSGKKIDVKIPKQILDSNIHMKRAFIRGYFDTDGCFRLDKPNKSKIAYYPKFEFTTISKNLFLDLKLLLKSLNLKTYSWICREKEYKLCIAGKNKTSNWIDTIFSRNPKNKKKLLEYQENFLKS